ncbi:MAG: hypothetical protein ACREQQ_10800 [Candidatus Binatia bacterium]
MPATNPLGEPTNPWMIHETSIFLFALIAGFQIAETARTRTLSTTALVFIAGVATFWQEFYDDWAVYLLWNPAFPLLPWGPTPYTTPYKPAFVPFAWGWFYSLAIPLFLRLTDALRRRRPGLPRLLVSALIVGPLLWAYDVGVEFTAVSNGWWSFTQPIGPTWSTPYGRYPIWYPVNLFVLWGIVFVRFLMQRDGRGVWWHERVMGIDRLRPGFGRELARAGAMALLFNATFLTINNATPFVHRIVTGGTSDLVP